MIDKDKKTLTKIVIYYYLLAILLIPIDMIRELWLFLCEITEKSQRNHRGITEESRREYGGSTEGIGGLTLR